MLDAYIYHGLRTPFGRHAGKLSTVRPDDLIGGVMQAVIAAASGAARRPRQAPMKRQRRSTGAR